MHPADTVAWTEQSLGTRVESTVRLPGGMSSHVFRCTLAGGRTIVVRHISDLAWLEREPDLIRREARALELLAGSPVQAPQLLAADPSSGRLAMTLLTGAMHVAAHDLIARVDRLAQLAATVGRVELPARHGLPDWAAWVPADLSVPEWGDHGLWNEGIAAFTAGRATPRPGRVLLHRDLHPLNVLWTGREVSGLVDWVNACVGHPHADLGHCRWNLAVLAGQPTADRFLARYLADTSGERDDRYDPWWDLATAIGLLPGPIGISGWHAVGRAELHHDAVADATESFIRAALDG